MHMNHSICRSEEIFFMTTSRVSPGREKCGGFPIIYTSPFRSTKNGVMSLQMWLPFQGGLPLQSILFPCWWAMGLFPRTIWLCSCGVLRAGDLSHSRSTLILITPHVQTPTTTARVVVKRPCQHKDKRIWQGTPHVESMCSGMVQDGGVHTHFPFPAC